LSLSRATLSSYKGEDSQSRVILVRTQSISIRPRINSLASCLPLLMAIFVGGGATVQAASGSIAGPDIHTEDVDAFYRLYDATDGHPTALQLQHEYLDAGSAGLHRLAQLRSVTGVAIAQAMEKRPDIYADAKRCMSVLKAGRGRVAIALRRLGALYPEAQFPPVTIAIGRGKPVGVTDATGVMIGLESRPRCFTTTIIRPSSRNPLSKAALNSRLN
jgi:hypothetical protein